MKHFYAFVGLLLLTSTLSFAQKEFKPGYIVQNGDTLRGLVNQQGDKRQALVASFKINADATSQNFSPSQITGYGITDGYVYEAKKISNPDSTYFLFLKVLVKGPANLYFYKDQNSGDHFFLEKADSLEELVYKKVSEVQTNGQTALVTYSRYKNTFYNAFKDCPTIGSTINQMQFKEVELINTVSLYNHCISPDSKSDYKVKARKSEITWGATIGATVGKMVVTGNQQPSFELTSKLGYQTGLALNITLPWASVNTSALLEAQYAYSSYYEQNYREYNSLQTNYTIDAAFHHLKLPASIRHTFSFGRVRTFINGGVIMNYALSQKQYYTGSSKYSYSNTIALEDGDFIQYTRDLSSGFILGGGIMYEASKNRKYSLEARYEKNNGFSSTPSYETIIHQISLLTGIYF
jgi:hypothetical protein